MPIIISSFLTRSNPNSVPYIVEDKDFKGGFRVLDDHAARDAIHAVARKPGMLVLTLNDGVIWQLLSGNVDWVEWNAPGGSGGGGGYISAVTDPLGVDVSGNLSIQQNRILPAFGSAGQIPVKQSNGSIAWENNNASGSVGTRVTFTKSDFAGIPVSSDVNFTLDMGRTVMLIDVTVNTPDLLIQCFSTPNRDEENPYTFKSAVGRLTDTGVSVLPDDSLQYNRRYGFVVNRESPTTTNLYWNITNQGSTTVTPVLIVTYLVLE